MTTYTISGFKLSYSGDNVSSLTPVALRIVAADDDDSFTYAVTGTDPSSAIPFIETSGLDPYSVSYNGVSDDDLFNSEFDQELAGYFSWSGGNVSYLIVFWDASANEDYIFQMGGTEIPIPTTIAEITAFNDSITSAGAITSGAYAPGQIIRLDDFTRVTSTENDIIRGGSEKNTYYAGAGRDKVYGGGGNDRLYGDGGKDKIWGDAGRDKMWGGKGDDKMWGGKGNDWMKGGGGADDFIYRGLRNEGKDKIASFQDGSDMIVIGGKVTFSDVAIDDVAKGTLLSWNQTTVLLKGIDAADITSADFDFI